MKEAYFGLSFGLSGCYMPDSHYGCFAITTRRELVALIKDALSSYDLPASLIRDVKINRLFDWGKRNGFSSMHFDLTHKGSALHFGGMTQAEYEEANHEI
jgi:hypothetical protein